MNLLLDTHAFILFTNDPDSIPNRAREALEDARNPVWLSLVTPWEMQIKITLGKLQVRKSPSQMVQFEVNRGALALLPISLGHIEELALLPSIHRDPFDRILIAQARCEKFIFITGDHIIRQYPIECLWE